jgi:hypothetical protein
MASDDRPYAHLGGRPALNSDAGAFLGRRRERIGPNCAKVPGETFGRAQTRAGPA